MIDLLDMFMFVGFVVSGTVAAALGAGALGAGIASLFGKKKKKAEVPAIPKLIQQPGQQLAFRTLQERLAGKGVGFRPGVISGAISPIAAQRRAGLQEQTIPLISAQASGRGLGRSTIPVSRIGLESRAAERDISQRLSELTLASEQQRRSEINQALADLQGFGRAELGAGLQGVGIQEQARLGQQQLDVSRQNQLIQSLSGLGIGALTAGTKTRTELLLEQILADKLGALVTKT